MILSMFVMDPFYVQSDQHSVVNPHANSCYPRPSSGPLSEGSPCQLDPLSAPPLGVTHPPPRPSLPIHSIRLPTPHRKSFGVGSGGRADRTEYWHESLASQGFVQSSSLNLASTLRVHSGVARVGTVA